MESHGEPSPRENSGARPAHLCRPPEALEDPEQSSRGIQLGPVTAVASETGESVVRVVPRISEADHAEPGNIAASIRTSEWTLPEHVTEGIDAPSHMVQDTDADGTCPQHRQERTGHRPRDRPSDPEGQRQGQQSPKWCETRDGNDVSVGEKIAAPSSCARWRAREQPAHVGMEQAPQSTKASLADRPW